MQLSVKKFLKVIILTFTMVAMNSLLTGLMGQASAMTLTEANLSNLIEKYGEENVIVGNGLFLGIGKEKSLSNGELGQVTWISTNDKIVQVIGKNTLKGISYGTTFVVGEQNGKYHILEVAVDRETNLARSLKTKVTMDDTKRARAYYKVFIDAGHGGKDPGAVSNGVREADINLSVALKVEQKLKERNVQVMMSRNTDVFVELKERARLANEYGADVFVSIHQNASTSSAAKGIETYYHENKPEHKRFASELQAQLLNFTGAKDRGVLSQDFLVNRETDMTSALVESGYITNYSEASLLSTDSYQEKVSNAIVEGIMKHLQENMSIFRWVIDNGEWYYVNVATGASTTGWVEYKSDFYYLDSNGVMKTGWILDNNKWYYLDENGIMKTGWVYISDGWYYFNDNGSMQTSWVLDGGHWYYLDAASGVMKSGWITYKNDKYYLDDCGIMKTEWILVNDNWYYLNQDGIMENGWISYRGYWYYLDNSGEMKTGWVTYNNKKYYLDNSGKMKTGWLRENEKWFFLNSDGAMQVGWLKDGGTTYYFNENGVMQTEWLFKDNTWFYFNYSGVMKTGWLYYGSEWYYLDLQGKMKTGWNPINGVNYYFYSDGHMASDVIIDGRKIDSAGKAS